MSPIVICEGTKLPSGGGSGRGGGGFPLPAGQEKLCIRSPKKQFLMHILGKDYKTIEKTSSFKHAFQLIFIILFSERAPLERTYISMSPKVICEDLGGGVSYLCPNMHQKLFFGLQMQNFSFPPPPSQGRENFAFGARKNSFWCIFGQR